MELHPPNHESVKDAQPTAEVIQEARERLIGRFKYSIEHDGNTFEHPGMAKSVDELINEIINGDTLLSANDIQELGNITNLYSLATALLRCSWLKECKTLEDLGYAMEKVKKRLDQDRKVYRFSDSFSDFLREEGILIDLYGKMKIKLECCEDEDKDEDK